MRHLIWLCLVVSSASAQQTVNWSLVVNKVSPAIVTIVSADKKYIPHGSGFIISSDGKVVTNFRVIEGKSKLLVRRSDGSFLSIKGILAADEDSDLVILKTDGRNLSPVKLGDSDNVRTGDAVCVISAPLVLEKRVSKGIVKDVMLKGNRMLLQITTPISKVRSGSPVFNSRGEVVGIASFYLAEGRNLNLAVPVNALKALLTQAKEQPTPLPIALLHFRILAEVRSNFDPALKAAQSITCNELYRSTTLADIARTMAKAGLFEQAIKLTQSIEDEFICSWTFYNIAQEMIKVGKKQQALTTLIQAAEIAQSIKEKSKKPLVLSKIAEEIANIGERQRAIAVFTQAFEVAQSIDEMSKRSWPLTCLAVAMARVGLFDQAINVAQSIENEYERSGALFDIAWTMAKKGLFDQAINVTQSIQSTTTRSVALRYITSEIAYARLFERAFEVAKGIEDPIERLSALVSILVEMRKIGAIREQGSGQIGR